MSDISDERSYFCYGNEQIAWLSRRDPKLGAYAAQRGIIERETHTDSFAGVVHAIIGQQISSKAQKSIWQRFRRKFVPFEPARIATAQLQILRECGISGRKAAYIAGVAREFEKGALSHEILAQMDDRALENKLTELPGIGKWTAEMLLIFTFGRPNVLSFGDLAIQRGMCRLYGYKEISRAIFDRHFSIYSPWATIASFYLWDIASRPLVS